MDLHTLVTVLWERRRLILVFMAAGLLAFGSIAFLMRPVYRATTVFIASGTGKNDTGGLGSLLDSVGGLASQAGINLSPTDADIEEAVAVLKSRQLALSFINEKNLMPELFDRKWDAVNKRWKVPPDKQPTPLRAWKKFDNDIRDVTRDKKTGLITLQIDWRDRTEAAGWANELVRRVNAEMRARAISKADASLMFLQKELEITTEVNTRDAISKLIASQEKQRMLANVTPDYSFRIVDPAIPPAQDDPLKPKKLVLLLAGPLAGFVAGAAWVLLLRTLRPSTRRRPAVPDGVR